MTKKLSELRDELAQKHFRSLNPLDTKNDHDGVMYIEKRFGSFCYGFDAAMATLWPVIEYMLQALDNIATNDMAYKFKSEDLAKSCLNRVETKLGIEGEK